MVSLRMNEMYTWCHGSSVSSVVLLNILQVLGDAAAACRDVADKAQGGTAWREHPC
jgi:hypothetical protein